MSLARKSAVSSPPMAVCESRWPRVMAPRESNLRAMVAMNLRSPFADGGVAGLAGAARPMAIDDLVATAKVFALTALAICELAG